MGSCKSRALGQREGHTGGAGPGGSVVCFPQGMLPRDRKFGTSCSVWLRGVVGWTGVPGDAERSGALLCPSVSGRVNTHLQAPPSSRLPVGCYLGPASIHQSQVALKGSQAAKKRIFVRLPPSLHLTKDKTCCLLTSCLPNAQNPGRQLPPWPTPPRLLSSFTCKSSLAAGKAPSDQGWFLL